MYRPLLELLESRNAPSQLAPTRCGASAPPVVTVASVVEQPDGTWLVSGTFTDDRPVGLLPFVGTLVAVGVPGVATLGVSPLWLPGEGDAMPATVGWSISLPSLSSYPMAPGMELAAVAIDVGCATAGPSFDFTL